MINDTNTRLEIANTILSQLGGGQFSLLVGLKNAMATESGLQFKIGKGAKRNINTVQVELDPSDTYTVKFWNCRGLKMNLISEVSDVYCDSLRQVFTDATGFYCTFR